MEQMTEVLKTAMTHDENIANCEKKEQFGRMTMETATKVMNGNAKIY